MGNCLPVFCFKKMPTQKPWPLPVSDLRKLGVHRDRFRLGECGAHFAQSLEEILPVFKGKPSFENPFVSWKSTGNPCGTKMERQNMPTNFAQKIWSTLVQTTPNPMICETQRLPKRFPTKPTHVEYDIGGICPKRALRSVGFGLKCRERTISSVFWIPSFESPPDIMLFIHGNAFYNDSGSFGLRT